MTNTKSKKKLYLMIAAGIAGLIILSSILTPYKTINIPNEIYDAAKEKSYYDNLLQNEKKIFWVGANCPRGNAKKNFINKVINLLSYEEFYTHVPLLITTLHTTNSAEIFFMDNCGNNICIIIPQRQIMLQIKKDKDLVKILKKVKDW